jgi:nicotinamidase/pyrazinamidase
MKRPSRAGVKSAPSSGTRFARKTAGRGANGASRACEVSDPAPELTRNATSTKRARTKRIREVLDEDKDQKGQGRSMSTFAEGDERPGAKAPEASETSPEHGNVGMAEEDALAADLLGFVLAGRPERIEDGLLALAPAPFRMGVRTLRELIANVGLCEREEVPSAEVRARLVHTVGRRLPRRALVVIDMIHDHLDPGALLEVPRARAVVPALKERLEAARDRGIPVVYVVDEHEADDPDLEAWGTHAVKGTKGTEVWEEIAPRPGDRIVKKPSYSAFFESKLGDVLEELAVDTLVLTGCLTEIGIMATATEAMQLGYAVEVPPDSQAGSCPELEAATIGTLRVMAPFGPARKARLERLAA